MVSLFGINLKPKLRNENQNRPGASVAGAPEKGDGQQRGDDRRPSPIFFTGNAMTSSSSAVKIMPSANSS
tara:strand:- start:128 stop:337 length:210 start_codon:yes stop_codon:yes gene_type:complete